MSAGSIDTGGPAEDFPVAVECSHVKFSYVSSGEMEIRVVRDDGEDIVHYVQLEDAIYEQLVEEGLLEP